MSDGYFGLLTKWLTSSDVDDEVAQDNGKNQNRRGGVCQDGIVQAAVDRVQKLCQQSLLIPLSKCWPFH